MERVIKKYANRRLYDTTDNQYIALGGIQQIVNQGNPIKVIDAKSNQDITRSVLLQIIVEQEKLGNPILSTELLQQIIQFYGENLQSFVGSYLEISFEAFKAQQNSLVQQLDDICHNNQTAEPVTKDTEVWQKMQDEIIEIFSSSIKPQTENGS